ncbi:hypothetical protein ACFQ4C_18080 [Larkinella insperata]|uniref:Uncharacterized protein n=1 Tax=Larkinella insperata TaxID=332158 RepID=A0ABW3QJJ4_9BACT|nr:hypothetical protein [Larkinella insperata]
MINLEEFYEAYGKSLATRLAAIGYTEANGRFVFVDDVENPAELVSKAVSKFPQGVNVLIWETFVEQLGDGGRDNYNTRIQGTLAVVRKDGTDNVSRKLSIRTARATALKVIALMRQDGLDGELESQGIVPQFNHDGEKFIISGGWAGYGFTFDWLVPLNMQLSDDDLV